MVEVDGGNLLFGAGGEGLCSEVEGHFGGEMLRLASSRLSFGEGGALFHGATLAVWTGTATVTGATGELSEGQASAR